MPGVLHQHAKLHVQRGEGAEEVAGGVAGRVLGDAGGVLRHQEAPEQPGVFLRGEEEEEEAAEAEEAEAEAAEKEEEKREIQTVHTI